MTTKGNLLQDVYSQNSAILNPQNNKYNGRINIIEPENPDARFQMYERLAVKNKATEYREAMVGEWEDSLLSKAYFSAGNVQILQNGLRAGVYKMSNNQIALPPQNIDFLKIVMRNTFMQYVNYSSDPIPVQIERLNKLVLDTIVPKLYGEAMGYMKYLQDQSTLVVPLELPQQNDRNYKQLELKPWV
jgi:Family of unknown function (DUF5761)